jgi:hypothetical protein
VTALDPAAAESRRCARFGWTSLALWAAFGLALEAAHGFKLAAYLDDDLRHSLLRLAHAHGVVLALVVLAFGRAMPVAGSVARPLSDAASAPTSDPPTDLRGVRRTGRLLRAGALIVPLGFALGAIRPHEGDPGLPVLLVPVGGLLLVAGLCRTAWGSWRAR